MLSETHTFSPTLINEFRFGFNWGIDANLQYNSNNNISAALGLNGVPFNAGPQNGGLPAVSTSWHQPLEPTATIRPTKARTITRSSTTSPRSLATTR